MGEGPAHGCRVAGDGSKPGDANAHTQAVAQTPETRCSGLPAMQISQRGRRAWSDAAGGHGSGLRNAAGRSTPDGYSKRERVLHPENVANTGG